MSYTNHNTNKTLNFHDWNFVREVKTEKKNSHSFDELANLKHFSRFPVLTYLTALSSIKVTRCLKICLKRTFIFSFKIFDLIR